MSNTANKKWKRLANALLAVGLVGETVNIAALEDHSSIMDGIAICAVLGKGLTVYFIND